MITNIKRNQVTASDQLYISDINSFLGKQIYKAEKNNTHIKGLVRLIKDGVPITDYMSNLVVGVGRRYVAQRLFQKKYTSDPQVWNYKITHVGFGQGGSTIVGSNVTLNGPTVCDEDLYVPLPLASGDNSYLTSPGDVANGVAATPFTLKRIEYDGSITVVENTSITCTNEYYTWVKCECIKAAGEPTTISDGESVKIDEAALYYTDYGSVAVGLETSYIFSHICFSPKWIEKESELLIEWYILC